MRILTFIGFYLLFQFASLAHAARTNTLTLCTNQETPLFSCNIKKKTLSVCAAKNISKTEGYLKYRFGKSEKIDFSYPYVKEHPSKFFRFHHGGSAKASEDQLSFTLNNFSYTVFVERAAFDFNGSGVFVKSNGKQIAYLPCNEDRPSPDNLYSLRDFKLESAEYEVFNTDLHK